MRYVLLILLSFPSEAATSPRDASPGQLKALAFKTAKKLRVCALPKGKVFVAVVNKTEDYIDPVPLMQSVGEGLRRKIGEKGLPVTLELSSAKNQSDGKYESTYTMEATYKPAGKEPCTKSEWMKLEGKL